MPENIKTFTFVICLLTAIYGYSESVHARSVEKQAVLAALTLNVARFTSWPEPTFNTDEPVLNLCIYGDNVVKQSFESLDKKSVNSKAIHIINLSTLGKLRVAKHCQLLYISKLETNRLIPLFVELDDSPILTIGENMKFIKAGGMVGLEKINGKIQLTINLPVIKQAKLIISSRLLKLANVINKPGTE